MSFQIFARRQPTQTTWAAPAKKAKDIHDCRDFIVCRLTAVLRFKPKTANSRGAFARCCPPVLARTFRPCWCGLPPFGKLALSAASTAASTCAGDASAISSMTSYQYLSFINRLPFSLAVTSTPLIVMIDIYSISHIVINRFPANGPRYK